MEFLLLPLLILGGFLATGGGDDAPDDTTEREDGTDEAERAEVTGRTAYFAGGGDDQVTASGNATVYGGAGDDQLSIDEAADDPTSMDPIHLYGGAGNDALYSALDGLESNTSLSGGAGDDYLLSFNEGDTLDGGDGADHLTAFGDTTLTGGAGADLFQRFVSEHDTSDGPMVITDYVAGEDRIGVSMNFMGDWMETMEITTEEVDGNTLVRFAFDQNAAAFPQGLDPDLNLRAPENFSILLQGVTDFDPTEISLLLGSDSDKHFDVLDQYTVENGTAGADEIVNDNFAPTLVFAGAGDDTISSTFRGIVSGGDGDDIVIQSLIAEPLDTPVTDDTSTLGETWTFGGAGNDLIVLEDDFLPGQTIYDYGVHNIGGFEVGDDSLGILLPEAEAGDVEVSFGTQEHSGFVTVEIAHAGGMLTLVLHGVTEAPAPGFVQLYANQAAVLAGTPYAAV